MTNNFYADLPAAPTHLRMIDAGYYRELPADWVIVMSDVKSSTSAIAEGRYKEVNVIGVSTIVAVQNALPGFEFPYVFGGDGATLAIPEACVPRASAGLALVRRLATERFGLTLRVALISVRTLREAGAKLECAKLKLSPTQTLALTRGDGWATAERWMKERETEFTLAETNDVAGALTGLECRWNPLPARRGEVLALIVQARVSGDRAEAIFREILGHTLGAAPITSETLKLRWAPRALFAEARMRTRAFAGRFVYWTTASLKIFLQMIYVAWRERPAGRDKPIVYLRELTENTDYLKFDQGLRMVIDVSPAEKARLIERLEAWTQAGEIDYGYHSDRHALMTCFIEGPTKHIHFVDAAGGGYALAARRLKEARAARA